ncbi:hypothetical protein PHYC_00781 [Phycisphaerales bacterium]|nr:hypothetical protein PHYC_00781 [Phycisphaerales bacterium]
MSRADARFDAVQRLLAEGRLEPARAACLRLVQGAPKDAGAAALMSELCERSNQMPQALHWACRAADLGGDSALLARAGWLCHVENQGAKGEKYLRRALEMAPGDARARSILANILGESRRFGEMAALVREGLARAPGDVELSSLLAGAMLNLARADEAAAILRGLCESNPGNAGAAGGLALVLNYVPGIEPREVFAAHRRFGEIIERQHPAVQRSFSNSQDPARRVRVGLVSPDLRSHSVAWFVEPILRHHDRAAIEIVVYQTNYVEDEVTARLRPMVSAWHDMSAATDPMLAKRIVEDRVDVVIELSGLTQAHSLGAMLTRPAPVSMTYLGYPNTTGLRVIDRRVVDSHTDPAGSEGLAVERLLRLDPCFLCYQPPMDAPEPAFDSAAVRPMTFGSFNSAQKINDAVIALWARVLLATPASRLVLKSVNFEDSALREETHGRLVRAGVEAGRIEVLPPVKERGGHLATYAAIDVALDPVPYNGTTTTCEALWMGVPVVTLAGRSHAGRVGVSILNAVGRPEWIATSEDAYVRIAAALAADRARLGADRRVLRAAMAGSVLCDGPGFCRRFESAVRDAWREWCKA